MVFLGVSPVLEVAKHLVADYPARMRIHALELGHNYGVGGSLQDLTGL